MFIDFIEEKLPTIKYILKFTRHKVPGGWYVRIIFTDVGHLGSGGRSVTAQFLADLEHAWQIDSFKWEMLMQDPLGGIFRAKVFGGWLMLTTVKGSSNNDGTTFTNRMGSLVFVQDPVGEWECKELKEPA